MPKEVIIIEELTDVQRLTTEAWGSLTAICQAHPDFQYHTIKKESYPFIHKGYYFSKLLYNHKTKK